jgi:hypothetical protein
MRDDLIGGTEALAMLGIRDKSRRSEEILREVGILPVFTKKSGRGVTVLVKRTEIEEKKAALELEREQANARERSITDARNGTTAEAAARIDRIEKKIDRLLALWGDSSPMTDVEQ